MAIPNQNVNERYIANGTNSIFSFNFHIVSGSHLSVYVEDNDGVVTQKTLGVDYSVSEVTDPDDPAQATNYRLGFITFLVAPPDEDNIVSIIHTPPLIQVTDIRNQGAFFPEIHESTFDYITTMVQWLQFQINRTLKIGITDTLTDVELGTLTPGYILAVKEDGSGFEFIDPATAGGGGGLPPAGADGEVLTTVLGEAAWFQYAFSGFSARFNAFFESIDLLDTLAKILNLQYSTPLVSLSTSFSGIRERGNAITSLTLTANVTKRSDPIGEVRFYQGSLIDTQTSGGAIPNGGSSTFAWTGSITDTTSFQAQADDTHDPVGTGTGNATVQFGFATFAPVGAAAMTPSDIVTNATSQPGAKLIVANSSSRNIPYTLTVGQKPYFAIPASFGALTRINDENGFDVISGWTRRDENITNAYGVTTSYYIYERDSIAGEGNSTNYTFIR